MVVKKAKDDSMDNGCPTEKQNALRATLKRCGILAI
jgi:hypothetical protein